MWDLIIGAILGTLGSIGTAIWIERLRRPCLRLEIEPPLDPVYMTPGNVNYRALRVQVSNKRLPWMVREAALQCHATVRFRHLDGRDVFLKPMEGRWAGSPQPTTSPIIDLKGQQIGALLDFNLMSRPSRIDIHPGETEAIDIAARFESDVQCYGWSNESYFSNPRGRNRERELGAGRYLVDVTVKSSGQPCHHRFVLMNDSTRSSFRLEPAVPPFLTMPKHLSDGGGGIVIRPRAYPPTTDLVEQRIAR